MSNHLSSEPCTFHRRPNRRSLVIVGLPASGKSSYARTLLAGRNHFEDIHHWLYYRKQHIRDGNDRFAHFLRDLQTGRPWVIDSVEMCEHTVRERFALEYFAHPEEIDWIFFENDPEQCRKNAQALERRGSEHRLHRLREIDRVTRVYDIPEDANRREVYRSVEQPATCTGRLPRRTSPARV